MLQQKAQSQMENTAKRSTYTTLTVLFKSRHCYLQLKSKNMPISVPGYVFFLMALKLASYRSGYLCTTEVIYKLHERYISNFLDT